MQGIRLVSKVHVQVENESTTSFHGPGKARPSLRLPHDRLDHNMRIVMKCYMVQREVKDSNVRWSGDGIEGAPDDLSCGTEVRGGRLVKRRNDGKC
jgi:hypothetical protein